MDHLSKSLEATHIGKRETAQSGAQSAIAAGVNVIDPNLLMAVMKGKSAANCDSDSENEAEGKDNVIEESVAQEKESVENVMKKAERERKLGRRAYKKKEFEKALSHFQKAIDLNPNEVAYHFRLAEAKFEQKRYAECVEICSRTIKVGKENKGSVKMVASSMVMRGKAQKEQGKLDKANADAEKAINFLTSIALIKLDKGRYYESFDFIHEAFGSVNKMLKNADMFAKKRIALELKVSIQYLEDYTKSYISSCQDKAEIKRHRVLTECKQPGDDAFKKNDFEMASRKYLRICVVYPRDLTQFLVKQAKAAEDKKKWMLCFDICTYITRVMDYFDQISSVTAKLKDVHEKELKKMYEEELKKTFGETRVLKAKALRRHNNFDEAFDKKFFEELAKKRAHPSDNLPMTYGIWNIQHPGPEHPMDMFEMFRDMACFFSENDRVTVKEFNTFMKCVTDLWQKWDKEEN